MLKILGGSLMHPCKIFPILTLILHVSSGYCKLFAVVSNAGKEGDLIS